MLTRTKVVVVACGTVTATFMGMHVASADPWGTVNCAQSPMPICDLDAGKGPKSKAPDPSTKPFSAPKKNSPNAEPKPQCSYVLSDYQPPNNGVKVAALKSTKSPSAIKTVALAKSTGDSIAKTATQGGWYVYRCQGPGAVFSLYRPPMWMDNVPPTAAIPSPEELAEQARSQLHLPSPLIKTSPSHDQLVGLPTWLWLDPTTWQQKSATAQVPEASVTATARPIAVSWSMGNGDIIKCTDPGTPYSPTTPPASPSPDCGYTYRVSSISQPGQVFPITVTTHWDVAWSGMGQSGVFPNMSASASTTVRVLESHALNTHPG